VDLCGPRDESFKSTAGDSTRLRLPDWLRRETYALPIDLFRVLVGLLSGAYFVSVLCQVQDFSSPAGLVDHRLIQHVFWFTRLSLFQPGLGDAFFRAVFALACGGSIAIVLGYRVKLFAGALFAIAVSTYRWNFIVMYVDDSLMHLLLLWLLLLPVGRTLVLAQWRREGRACWARWLRVKVPGTAVYALLGNLCLIYLVAGLWKLESPFWRNGFALYATLRLPIGRFPDLWGPQHLPWLRLATHAALAIEVGLPFLLLLRAGHPLKWVGLACLLALHLGIVATLRIPFANLGCLAADLLFFREEIMRPLLSRERARVELGLSPRVDRAGRVALGLLALLTLAMMRRLPLVGEVHKPAYALLWLGGVAQDYQLFNWIDKKNWRGEILVWSIARGPSGVAEPAADLFPPSLRGVLLQAYLHDVRWIKVPREHRETLKQSILSRAAQRFCRRHPTDAVITETVTQRITPDTVNLDHGETRFMMEFQCRDGDAVVCRTFLNLERSPECWWPPWKVSLG